MKSFSIQLLRVVVTITIIELWSMFVVQAQGGADLCAVDCLQHFNCPLINCTQSNQEVVPADECTSCCPRCKTTVGVGERCDNDDEVTIAEGFVFSVCDEGLTCMEGLCITTFDYYA